jgi:hypothetical protein
MLSSWLASILVPYCGRPPPGVLASSVAGRLLALPACSLLAAVETETETEFFMRSLGRPLLVVQCWNGCQGRVEVALGCNRGGTTPCMAA